MIRVTASLGYSSGSEVLLVDTGALPDIEAVRAALRDIAGTLDQHATAILEGGAELVVRVAEREFSSDRTTWRSRPKRPVRARRELEF